MSLRQGRPSPALIVAAIALTFALVGTSVAADPVAKLNKSKVKKIAKKQADKRLKANVSGSRVNTADNATNATNATVAGNVLTKVGPGDPGVLSPASTAFFDVVNLALPAGSYVVMGKASIDNDDAAAIDVLACRLLVNSDEDRVIDALELQSGTEDDTDTIALNLPVNLAAAGNAIIQCNNPLGGAGDVEVHFARITALPVRSVTGVPFP